MFTYLLHEKDENLPEDLDKVNEEVKGVGDEVLVSVPCLPDDHLGVKHDEPAEDGQPNVQMSLQKIDSIHVQLVPVPLHLYLEKQLGPKEDVEEAKDEESGEPREESATQVEVLAIRSKESCAGEAGKDGGGEHEGGRHQGGVDHDRHGKEGSEAETCEEGEGHQH